MSDQLKGSDPGAAAGKVRVLAASDSLEAVAERWPLVGQALERVGLARSASSVADLCRLKGWDLPTTLDLLEAFGGIEPSHGEVAFELIGVDQICDQFAEGDHRDLKARMRRVMDAVADENGETGAIVRARAQDLETLLDAHLALESEVLQTIRDGGSKRGLRNLLGQMRREHEALLELWSDLKLAFEDCCSVTQIGETQAAVRREIDALDERLQRQVFLENNLLFRRSSVLEVGSDLEIAVDGRTAPIEKHG